MITKHSSFKLPTKSRILLIKLGNIGTGILLTPAIKALRETYPEASIDLLTKNSAIAFFKNYRLLNDVIPIPSVAEALEEYSNDDDLPQQYNKVSPLFLSALATLRSKHYDALLIFDHLIGLRAQLLRLYANIISAKYCIGLDRNSESFLSIPVMDYGYGVKHEAEYYMDVAKAAGADIANKALFLPLTDSERHQAKDILLKNHIDLTIHPIIAMHPGSSLVSIAKRWPADHFASLADTIYRRLGGQLVLMGDVAEYSLRHSVAQMRKTSMPCLNLSGKEDIRIASAIIEQCNLFIGNDSGLMHIAAAVNTPTIGIFGLTNHNAWGPYTPNNPEKSRVIKLDLPCMPCYYHNYEVGNRHGCTTRECINHLSTPVVAQAVFDMLEGSYKPNNYN